MYLSRQLCEAPLVAKLVDAGIAANTAQGWEHNESTDWAALRDEVGRALESGEWDVIIAEGFRLFHDDWLSSQMQFRIWIDICKETCRRRRNANPGNGPVSPETFEQALWPLHEKYRGTVLQRLQVWNVCGEHACDVIHAEALRKVNGFLATADWTDQRVEIVEPWLSYIVEGPKLYEGRVFKNTWAKLVVGDVIEAYSSRFSSVKLKVNELLRFDDFDKAFEVLGKTLLPSGAETPDEALRLYRQWNPAEVVRRNGGVVAVGVDVLESHLCDESAKL